MTPNSVLLLTLHGPVGPSLKLTRNESARESIVTEIDQQPITYKTGTIESSGAVLALRVIFGLPIALVAGFIGGVFNNVAVPAQIDGDVPDFLAPLIVTSIFAAVGGMIAWFNRFDSKRGTVLMWAVSTVGGLLGALVAYYIGDRYIGPVDLHVLNKRLSQAVLIGAAVGVNVTAAIVAISASKMGR
mgnify:CR=1 FL=1